MRQIKLINDNNNKWNYYRTNKDERHLSGERNLGSTLNLKKKTHHSESWSKKFRANVHKPMNFISSKNEDFSIRIVCKFYAENFR